MEELAAIRPEGVVGLVYDFLEVLWACGALALLGYFLAPVLLGFKGEAVSPTGTEAEEADDEWNPW